MDKFQRHFRENKTDTKENILCDSIYMNFERQNEFMVPEIEEWLHLGGRGLCGHKGVYICKSSLLGI